MKLHRQSSSSYSNNSLLPCSPIRCFFYVLILILLLLLGILIYPLVYDSSPISSAPPTESVPVRVDSIIFPNLRTENPQQPQEPLNQAIIQPKMKPTVAYAITVTKDGPFVDGALVLGYAAKKYHSQQLSGISSAYNCDLIAFVTKEVKTSREILIKFGWKIYEKELPVAIEEIENQVYAQNMKNSGCCGASEFLKLWAFTLIEYHRVIHLDMDSIIFQNLDELYNLNYELLFTGDYNMMSGSPYPPAQGGFFVIKPSIETFQEFQAIIKKGDHRPGGGWGGSHIGNFWGGQTIQGIIPYYYNILHPGKALELNRCYFNCMVDNPYRKGTTRCLNKQTTCEDCRLTDFEKIKSAHFTICQKPWTCTYHSNPLNKVNCEKFHNKWFQLRDEYEQYLGIDTEAYRTKKTKYLESKGMCKGYGDDKYLPLPVSQLKSKNIPQLR
jgi:hypothetical protein